MPKTYTAEQFIIGIIVAILVAGGAGYLLGSRSVKDDVASRENDISSVDANTELNLAAADVALRKNMLSVTEPQVSGSIITISRAVLENDAWVAIHADEGGTPARILGAQRFRAGTTENAPVELLRQVTAGTYHAMLHVDDGDSAFDHKKDLPLLDNGIPVSVKFTVTPAVSL
ncbi:MAG: hypothetical protein HY471_02505 [Candidatus Sungbacteria bacterium]|nr:hypothetical protein [Candidatus Sungbacteria bacterium]